MKKRSIKTDQVTKLIYSGEQLFAISVQTFELKVLTGTSKGISVLCNESEALIGSAKGCNLIVSDDPTVSRNHCVIQADDQGFHLRDFGSTNGTWLGNARVESAYLTDTTDITVGHTRIRFSPQSKRVEISLSKENSFGKLLGNAARMRDVFARLERVAPTDVTVLLEGESGTGKELAAHGIHKISKRNDKPFEIFDCAAVAPSVIESELFGHEKGAFTGALIQYQGVFERADGGTLFIDEVGELRSDLQPKLLRALETGQFRRIGGTSSVKVDVRVIAATNRDLRTDVNHGTFRLDLFFRLAGVRIVMPSLRERSEDIGLLVRHFADEFALRHGTSGAVGELTDDTIRMLSKHSWKGNVRELRNFVEQSLVLAELAELPAENPVQENKDSFKTRTDLPYKEARELLLTDFCRSYFVELLERNNYNVTKTASEAGIDRVYAQRIIKKYDLKKQL